MIANAMVTSVTHRLPIGFLFNQLSKYNWFIMSKWSLDTILFSFSHLFTVSLLTFNFFANSCCVSFSFFRISFILLEYGYAINEIYSSYRKFTGILRISAILLRACLKTFEILKIIL